MNGIVKALTCVLGILAVIACLATVGILGYSMTGTENDGSKTAQSTSEPKATQIPLTPTEAPNVSSSPTVDSEKVEVPEPTSKTIDMSNHVHDYVETVEVKATCYKAGRIKYECECGDSYYIDIMSTGHVAGDWEIVRKPTSDKEGLRVKKCIYCDEIIAQESIPFESTTGVSGSVDNTKHVHQYTASIEREPSCVLAGLRKYTCSCGSFYTEMIPAPGHVASDWTVAEAATTTQMGTEQRTCKVCGVVLDSRPINVLSPSPSASAGTSPSASASTTASASPSASAGQTTSPSPTPTATPHSHNYQSYVLKEANCTEKGIRSFVCSCGSSYAESIELDLNNHSFRSVVIPATSTTQGYTVYTCIRCNYSYYDNYTPALKN
ncbi:MAG: hypothetical protein SOV61_12360 [Lachnospiraceae bacterium]|nr:hypothetical protein [Lachnospiraceae bacterium]